MVKILAINYLSDLEECNPENDNLDVHIVPKALTISLVNQWSL